MQLWWRGRADATCMPMSPCSCAEHQAQQAQGAAAATSTRRRGGRGRYVLRLHYQRFAPGDREPEGMSRQTGGQRGLAALPYTCLA